MIPSCLLPITQPLPSQLSKLPQYLPFRVKKKRGQNKHSAPENQSRRCRRDQYVLDTQAHLNKTLTSINFLMHPKFSLARPFFGKIFGNN